MSRLSTDQLASDGTILNGYDYNIQVWVSNGIVTKCGHPFDIDSVMGNCCNAGRYAGQRIADIDGHEVR